MDAKELAALLKVLKEFDVSDFKMGDIEIKTNFSRPAEAKKTLKDWKPNFPDAKYAASVMSQDITEEELAVLGLAGVAPVKAKSVGR